MSKPYKSKSAATDYVAADFFIDTFAWFAGGKLFPYN